VGYACAVSQIYQNIKNDREFQEFYVNDGDSALEVVPPIYTGMGGQSLAHVLCSPCMVLATSG